MLTGSKIADSTMMSVVGVGHLGLGAAHDPGDPDRTVGVGDDERLLVERPLHVIERLEPFPGFGPSDDDPPIAHGGGIERVDRLAQFQHHVVAGIDDVADRPHAGGLETHLDPVRRRTDGHVTHPSSDEPRTEFGLADLDGQPFLHGWTLFIDRPRRGNASVAPVMAATSRARPTIDRASPRFGLTSTSRTVSP